MRYIKQPARTTSENCEFEIIEDTPEKKLYCFCIDLKDAKTVVNALNSAERSRDYRASKKYRANGK